MAGKDKIERGFRIYVDDAEGIPQDLSGDLVPGTVTGGGKVLDEVELTGVSNSVKNYLAGHASAPINARFHFNDTSSTGAYYVLSRVLSKITTVSLVYGANGSAPVLNDPAWSGEYVCVSANIVQDGGRFLVEAVFSPAADTLPAWVTYTEGMITALFGSRLIQYLPLDDQNATARDASGNSRTGTYSGAYTQRVTGPVDFGLGYGVDFLGTGTINAYTASLGAAFVGAEVAFSTWVKFNSLAVIDDANTYNFLYYNQDSTHYYQMRKVASNQMTFFIRVGASIPAAVVMTPNTTRWLHLTGVCSKAGDYLLLYVNGTKASYPVNTIPTFTGPIAAASLSSSSIGNLPGKMAHFNLVDAYIPTDAEIWAMAGRPDQIAFDGDSRTGLKTWPMVALEAATPNGNLCYGGMGAANFAVTGNTIATMTSRAASGTDTIIKPGAKSTLVVWTGVNDTGLGSAAAIYAALKTFCQGRRAIGYNKIIICTEIDGQSVPLNAAGWHTTIYPALNTLIRNGYTDFADAVIDLGGDARLQDATNLTYFNADAVHLTAAGYAAVAEVAAPVIKMVINS